MGDRQMLPVQTKQTLSNPSSSRSERDKSAPWSGSPAHSARSTRAPGPTPSHPGAGTLPHDDGSPSATRTHPQGGSHGRRATTAADGSRDKQRALITMTPEEVDAFIHERGP